MTKDIKLYYNCNFSMVSALLDSVQKHTKSKGAKEMRFWLAINFFPRLMHISSDQSLKFVRGPYTEQRQ